MHDPYDKILQTMHSGKPFDVFDAVESQTSDNMPEELKKDTIDSVQVILQHNGMTTQSSFLGMDTSVKDNPHLFKIASITKSMIAALVYRLHEVGLLDVNAPALNYITYKNGKLSHGDHECKFPDLDGITVDDLLRHTSGLDNYVMDFDAIENKGASRIEALAYTPQKKYEDKTFHYSNTNYLLIALVLENPFFQKKAREMFSGAQGYKGNNVADLLRHFIFIPCGMQDAFLHTENGDQNIPWNRVHGGVLLKNPDTTLAMSYDLQAYEAGGVICSIQDVSRFWDGLFRGKIFSNAQTLGSMIAVREDGRIGTHTYYAAGLYVVESTPNEKVYMHTGGLPGSDSHGGFIQDLQGGRAYACIRTYKAEWDKFKTCHLEETSQNIINNEHPDVKTNDLNVTHKQFLNAYAQRPDKVPPIGSRPDNNLTPKKKL